MGIFSLLGFVNAQTKSFYDFKVNDINGNEFDLKNLKGKKVMVVNVASECGFTPQYADLENLYKNYKENNFVIIGFPCNDFGGQEPAEEKEIKEFCMKNYGTTFPLMSKVEIKTENPAPIYQWLTKVSENGVSDAEVKWNFNKFLIDENGKWVKYLPSRISPFDKEIIGWLESK